MLGHSEPGAQKHSASTLGGTFRPGRLGTHVDDYVLAGTRSKGKFSCNHYQG